MSVPFLRVKPPSCSKCLLCDEDISKTDVVQAIKTEGLKTIRSKSELWSKVEVCDNEEPYFQFTQTHTRIPETLSQELKCHKGCRTLFMTRLERYEKKFGLKPTNVEESVEFSIVSRETLVNRAERLKRNVRHEKHLCFICNAKTSKDDMPAKDGGLIRCSDDNTEKKLKSCMNKYNEAGHKFEAASKRLSILLAGTSHDIFALDVYYHLKCYSSFALPRVAKVNEDENRQKIAEAKQKVNEVFYKFLDQKLFRDEEAFLLAELLEDIKSLSEEHNLEEPTIKHTHLLKKELQKRYGEKIGFHILSRKLIVYPAHINPCVYVASTVQGFGLRDDYITKAFAAMVRRKLAAIQPGKWPLSPEEVIKNLVSEGPNHCIYNAIAWSADPGKKKNRYGYVESSSKAKADKIWAIASDWQCIVRHERSVKSTALSLALNRLTGSKEGATLLHQFGHGISYSDIRLLTNTWADLVTNQSPLKLPPGFIKGQPIHVTCDNSDGRQQTITGSYTTHHTNGTVFQIQSSGVSMGTVIEPSAETLVCTSKEIQDYGHYKITKRMSPAPVPEYEHKKEDNLLQWCLKRDVAWVLTSFLRSKTADIVEEIDFIGSWTAFMKSVTPSNTDECFVQYLEVIPLPPTDNICKWYLDMMLQFAEDLEISCIFAHADEAINCKMLMIKWLHEAKYDRIVTLIGGFHTILVKLRILHKKYGALGLKEWWIDAGAVAQGSADQAEEGRHYYRSLRLHKQSFEALLRFRIEKNDVESKLSNELKSLLHSLMNNPSANVMFELLNIPELCELLDFV